MIFDIQYGNTGKSRQNNKRDDHCNKSETTLDKVSSLGMSAIWFCVH